MARKTFLLSRLVLVNFICCMLLVDCDDKKEYIVYMGDKPKAEILSSEHHMQMLQDTLGSDGRDSLLYSYTKSFNGFVAKLTETEAQKISGMEGVVSIFANEMKQLHTTRSWDFMGFTQQVKRAKSESDIIVGMLDTGIWPESQSFTDEGYSPPPKKWKGICQSSANFTCNNKIIGARYYRMEQLPVNKIESPRDAKGHGTHTASIVAGNSVTKASLFGLALGTARGGIPSARIAVYKICFDDGCPSSSILAAFDDAIADGVDIISISVGDVAVDYFDDPIAIGAFHAMKNGILTSNSAGNAGPNQATVHNVSPWSLSVAASTIDRKFVTSVQLGDDEVYKGTSVNTFDLKRKKYPLIYAGDAPNTEGGFNGSSSRLCIPGSLNKNLVRGKIVLCDSFGGAYDAFNASIIGAIMPGAIDVAFPFPVPASNLYQEDYNHIYNYLKATSQPVAAIQKSTVIQNDQPTPNVVYFSSRGPNPITADILKPDITAPGVDILAAWSEMSSVTNIVGDKRVVPYNIVSGTSMSCPHATAVAAYVKSFNPTWSPAAIKSALMTTASSMDDEINIDKEFAYGAGHINPVDAVEPGLIYDAGEVDYINFLCGHGYNSKMLQLVTGNTASCSNFTNTTTWDLNYPSFALSTKESKKPFTHIFHRTVTNVGSANSKYTATVKAPLGLDSEVIPSVLSFKSLGEQKSFVLKVQANLDKSMISGLLVWDDGVHKVRSPIVAYKIDAS